MVELWVNHSDGAKYCCSGTLIAPQVVLTAKHCVNWMAPFVNGTVFVGRDGADDNGNAMPGSTKYPVGMVINFGGNTPYLFGEAGADVSLVFLSRPVLEGVRILRPSLAVPFPKGHSPTNPDSDGGRYAHIGVAGYSPLLHPNPNRRQAWVWDEVQLWHGAGLPATTGRWWQHGMRSGQVMIDKGDSGGRLFVLRPDGHRDVIGVAALMVDRPLYPGLEYWTDVTRGDFPQWIRANVQDRGRTARWLAQHGKTAGDFWLGEADYSGPCNAFDHDCDRWEDPHDNCKSVFNPDQADGNDDGRGDACSPALPTAAPTCSVGFGCGDRVTFQCARQADAIVVERTDGKWWHGVESSSNYYYNFVEGYASPGLATFRLCSVNDDGSTCGGYFEVTVPPTSKCGGGGGGGSGPRPPPGKQPPLL